MKTLLRFQICAALLTMTGCFEPASTTCSSGLVCAEGSKCTHGGAQCIPVDSTCGDGKLDPGEQCDDGNIAGNDACSADCTRIPVCGDAVIDTAPDGSGEECDDGAPDGGPSANGGPRCSTVCLLKRCGDHVVDQFADGQNEECDDGNRDGSDGCGPTCLLERCGNEHLDPGEVCDTGAWLSGDGCRADCRGKEVCGDGLFDPFSADGGLNERCDDGNVLSGDGCSQDCKGIELCGDGQLNAVFADGGLNEECDDGNTFAGDSCSPTCRNSSMCGNAFVDFNPDGGFPREQCDDGNTVNNDACTNQCLLGICGDGVLRPGVEECDTNGESPTCNRNCTARRCGDGIVNASAGEQCDVLGGAQTAACDVDCTVAFCGDSTLNMARGETCDTGGDSVSCNANCSPARCGDGILNLAASEQCDTGGDSAYCDADCTPASCGDNRVNLPAGEACDDGNFSNLDDCLPTCQANVCGDGFRDQQGTTTEACDDGNVVTETACPYGEANCSRCDATCATLLNLTGSVCGDGVVNAPQEQCDDGNSLSCGSCNASCSFAQPLLEAQGAINTDLGSALVDGETFTLNDGMHSPTVFCFKQTLASLCGGTQIVVDLTAGGLLTQEQLGDFLIVSINAVAANLAITASKRSANPWVRLTNDAQGGFGNQVLLETVASPLFFVTGMSGGGGADCPLGTGCVSGTDCSSGICASSRCQ